MDVVGPSGFMAALQTMETMEKGPVKKVAFSVKMPATLHARLKAVANRRGISMNAVILNALEEYLKN